MSNPYEAPESRVADPPQRVRASRPWMLVASLIILWLLLILWMLAVTANLHKEGPIHDRWALFHAVYLVGMIVVPAFLLIMIARARNWARVAAAMLAGLDFLWRLYLTVVDPNLPASALGYVLAPAVIQLAAYLLLWTPRANAWFRSAADR